MIHTNIFDVSETAQLQREIHNNNRVQHNQKLNDLYPSLPVNSQRCVELAREKALHCGCWWFRWGLMASALARVIFFFEI